MEAIWLSVNFQRSIISPRPALKAAKREFSLIRWFSLREAGHEGQATYAEKLVLLMHAQHREPAPSGDGLHIVGELAAILGQHLLQPALRQDWTECREEKFQASPIDDSEDAISERDSFWCVNGGYVARKVCPPDIVIDRVPHLLHWRDQPIESARDFQVF